MAKMTQTEWFNMFDTKFEHEINDFRHSDNTLFGNEDITTELKFAVGTVIRNMFRVKMEINQVRHCVNRTVFLLTDYDKVQFFAAEYYEGYLSIGVKQGRKCVYNHVLNIAEYTKDGNSTSKLRQIIHSYISVFISMMNIQHNINVINDIADKKII